MKLKYTLRHFLALAGSSLLAISSASAFDYTWGGGNLLWTNTTASGWNGGPPAATDTATINSGTVTFAANDTFGQASVNTPSTAITVNTGGTLASGGKFNLIWNLTLGGGTLLSNGGVSSKYPTFNLAGTVTAAGGVTSSISTGSGSNNIINLGNGTTTPSNTTFNVGAAGTLNVGTGLNDHQFNPGTNVTGLIKTGNGVMNLNATNTYTGATTISGGILQFGKVNSLYNGTTGSWTAANIRVASGGTLALNVGGTGEFSTSNVGTLFTNLADSTNATTNGMAAGSNFGFDTTNASGGSFEITQVVANSGGPAGGARGLIKLGTGILELSNTNTYTGATTVSGGTLALGTTGSIANSSTITVATGATLDVSAVTGGWSLGGSQTLGGTGTITGAITVDGNLNPGASPGVISFSSSLALGANSTTTMEIDGTTRGTQYDGVNVGSTLGLDGSLVFDFGNSSAFDSSADFDLFSFTTASTGDFDSVTSTGFYTGTWGKTGDIWSLTDEGQTLNFSEVTGNLTVIPEPRAALLGGLGMLVLLRRRRTKIG